MKALGKRAIDAKKFIVLSSVAVAAGLLGCAGPVGYHGVSAKNDAEPLVSLGAWRHESVPQMCTNGDFDLSVDLAGDSPRYRVVVAYWLNVGTGVEAFEVRLRTKWGDYHPLHTETFTHWVQPLLAGVNGTYIFECYEKPTEVLVAVAGTERAFVVPP